MATDATGTPTSPDGLAKINPSVDAPSGGGHNSLADSIQTALTNNYVRKPAGLATAEVPVWNGSAWVRSSVTQLGPTSLGTGTPDATKFLRGDGSWQVVSSGPTWTYAATPPVSPTTGDIWIYRDADPNSTYTWAFRYNSANTTYKWEFSGGSSLYGFDATRNTTSSGSYGDPANNVSLTVPRAGVYRVDWSVLAEFNASGTNQVGYVTLSIAASDDANAARAIFGTGTTVFGTLGGVYHTGAIAASSVIKLRFKGPTDSSIAISYKSIAITPIRVS